MAIPEEAADRLDRLAQREYRDRKQQAAILLVDAIERAESEPGRAIVVRTAEPAR